MLQRPDTFWLNPHHHFANELVFAGLGAMAGSTHYHDSSLYGNNGTLTNMVPATNWVFDNELGRHTCGGFSQTKYINFTSPELINLPTTGAFSVSFWAKKQTASVLSTALAWGGTDDLLLYVIETAYETRTFWRDCGASLWDFDGVNLGLAGAWHHYTQMFADGSQNLYIDGVLKKSNTQSLAGAGPFTSFRLGNWADLSSQDFTDGSLSDVLIHSSLLSLPEIKTLADPSNVMLSGLILPPQRKWWPVVSGGAPAFAGSNLVLGGGIVS